MRTATILGGIAALSLTASGFAGLPIVINEVDADTPGTDAEEFIELYDGGIGGTSLDGLAIVLYNGSDDLSYNDAIDLDGFSTDAAGYFVIGSATVPNVDLVAFTTNGVQNGADAVVLLVGDAIDFPNDSPLPTSGILDAVVYDTNDGDDAGLLVLLNPGEPQVNEAGGAGGSANDSIGRCPDGSGGQRNTSTYLANTPSPGGPNTCVVAVGACCNTATGVCTDGLTSAECSGPDDVWTEGALCGDVFCDAIPVGSCCNEVTGDCTDGVTEEDCNAVGGVWGGDDVLCADVVCESTVEAANVIISEIVDATLPGGQPKWVELTNCDTVTVDLSFYSVGNYSNGSTTLGGGSSTALSGSLAPGESFVFAYSADTDTSFVDTYGVAPSQYAGGGFINGDDVVALFLGVATGDGSDALLVDVYGVIGVDGTGEVWEHTDGYSFRSRGSAANPTFDPSEWLFGGVNSLETGDDVEELALILALTSPFSHSCAEICPDLTGDGVVSFVDLVTLLSSWGDCVGCPADLDGNGSVNFNDLLKLLSKWGPCS